MYIDMIDMVVQHKCFAVLYVPLALPITCYASKSPRVPGINMQPSSHRIQLLSEGNTSTVVATQSHPSFYLHGIRDTSMTQQTPGTCSLR